MVGKGGRQGWWVWFSGRGLSGRERRETRLVGVVYGRKVLCIACTF